jgi:protease PrsW
MVLVLVLFLAAVAPAAFLLHFYYVRDKYEREPMRLMLKVYFISCLSVIPAALLEISAVAIPTSLPTLVKMAILSFIIIGPIEEAIKFIFLRWLAFHRPEFNEPYDGILYAVTVSLGFATAENVLYVIQGGIGIALVRALLSVPLHACLGVIMGSFVGRAKFTEDAGTRSRLLWLGFLLPAFAHGLFDFFVLSIAGDVEPLIIVLFVGLLIVTVIGLWVIALRFVRKAQEVSPFKTPNPIISPIKALENIGKN